jgi:hypothetical protein
MRMRQCSRSEWACLSRAADAAAAEQEHCEDAEDTVIYHAPVNSECHAPVNSQWVPAQRRSCAEGCGGWEQVERLLAADRAQPALDKALSWFWRKRHGG